MYQIKILSYDSGSKHWITSRKKNIRFKNKKRTLSLFRKLIPLHKAQSTITPHKRLFILFFSKNKKQHMFSVCDFFFLSFNFARSYVCWTLSQGLSVSKFARQFRNNYNTKKVLLALIYANLQHHQITFNIKSSS